MLLDTVRLSYIVVPVHSTGMVVSVSALLRTSTAVVTKETTTTTTTSNGFQKILIQ